MACRLLGTKPLPELIVGYYQLDHWEKISVKFISEFNIFTQENAFENVFCQNGGHFVQGDQS